MKWGALTVALAIAAVGLAGGVSLARAPQGEDSEVALEATVELPAELVARTKQRLDRKAQRGPKPKDKPAEAQNFFLFQRMPIDPADYANLANEDGKIEMPDQAIPMSAGGYYEALSEAQEHIRTEMPWATFGPDGIAMHAPGEGTGRAARDLTNWVELGPGNISGRTRALLIEPSTPNTMYAAGVAGGVWKTTNGGTHWTPLDDLMDNLAVCTLAFEGQGGASVNPAVVYAGTGEGYFNGDAVRGAGIFKSTNSGATWTQLASTANSNFYYVNKIVASPNSTAVLYAATRSGVWKTADSGATWTRVLANTGTGLETNTTNSVVLTGTGSTDIEIRTDLATDNLIVSNGSFTTDGIYRSDDAGATWDRTYTATGLGRSDLAIAPSSQGIMYALSADTGNGDRLLNVFRSSDGGANWTAQIAGAFDQRMAKWLLLSNPLAANYSPCFGDSDFLLNQGWYDNIIAVDPTNPARLFAGGIDLFRSEDSGATWGLISYWWLSMANQLYAHADQHAIVFHPDYNGTTNQTVFVGSDGGVFKTSNAVSGTVGGGVNDGICYNTGTKPTVIWTSLNNSYGTTQFYAGRPYPDPTTTYFGGTQDNGTLRGTDAAGLNGWTEIMGGDGGYVSFDSANTNTLFAEYTGKSLTRSKDGGVSFPDPDIVNGAGQVTEGVDPAAAFPFIAPFRHDPNNANRIWYGAWYAWRSTNASSAASNASVSWTQAGALTPGNGSISAWAISPNDSDQVWAGLSDGYVVKTTQGTTSTSATAWTDVTSASLQGTGYISWLEVDGNDVSGNTAYLTNSRFGLPHVMRTTNGGTSWTNITNNLPDIPAHCIVVQPGTPANLFVGTDLGLFASTDTGATWASANNPGFANVVVETLEFQSATTLYAFTHGRGVFRVTVQPSTLTLAVTPSDRSVTTSAGSTTFDVSLTGTGSATWTASTTDPWISSITPSTGTANQTISVNYAENTSGSARQATITVTAPGTSGSPVQVTVSQAAVPQADLEVTPASQSVAYASGSTSFSVANVGNASMTWTAASGNSWITSITPSGATNAAGTSTTIAVAYELNPTPTQRTASILVTAPGALNTPATVTVVQAGNSSIALSVTPASRAVTPPAGTTSYAVDNTGTGNLVWTATFTPPVAWALITSGGSGTNAGTIMVSYNENAGIFDRTASITVSSPGAQNSPMTLSLMQDGVPSAWLNLSPTTLNVAYTATATSFNVQNIGNLAMPWLAAAQSYKAGAPWFTINPSSGTDSALVTVSVDENPYPTPRAGVIRVTAPGAIDSPMDVSLSQEANSTLVLQVTPSVRNVASGLNTTTFAVTNTGGGLMDWFATVDASAPWLSIQSGGSGTNAGTVTVLHQQNATGSIRTGTLTVMAVGVTGSPAQITVEQACEPLGAPTGVSASDGAFTDRVRLAWSAVPGRISYGVYRNRANDFSSAILLGNWTGTTADDFSAVIDSPAKLGTVSGCNPSAGGGADGKVTYYYWVTTLSSCGQSAPSVPDRGNVGG